MEHEFDYPPFGSAEMADRVLTFITFGTCPVCGGPIEDLVCGKDGDVGYHRARAFATPGRTVDV